MQEFQVSAIGQIRVSDEGTFVELKPEFIPALKALEGFSHLSVIWWFDGCDSEELRKVLVTKKPYRLAPEEMGIFATRSPVRPNPIALTAVQVVYADYPKGIIQIAYIDANDGSPVLDIKPYTPSLDRVMSASVPAWCSHWPKSLEESGDFDWEGEMIY